MVSTTINKYIYVAVNKRFEDEIRVSYSETEIVKNVDEIKHNIIREALKIFGVGKSTEVVTIADIPGKGTGLGSSSSLSVGLIKALVKFLGGSEYSPEYYARMACEIEIVRCRQPIGKQDQYSVAYGGFNYIKFNADDSVEVKSISLTNARKTELEESLLCFYTGITRSSSEILSEQKRNIPWRMEQLDRIRDLADEVWSDLNRGDLTSFGEKLHENWMLKKALASGVTSHHIDDIYDKALRAGAVGGKVNGAGGGGFLTLYVPTEKKTKVRKVLSFLRELEFRFADKGSEIVYAS